MDVSSALEKVTSPPCTELAPSASSDAKKMIHHLGQIKIFHPVQKKIDSDLPSICNIWSQNKNKNINYFLSLFGDDDNDDNDNNDNDNDNNAGPPLSAANFVGIGARNLIFENSVFENPVVVDPLWSHSNYLLLPQTTASSTVLGRLC